MTPDDITVLIPAAGRVPDGILALSNVSSPAMIPVAGRPVIYWTLHYLRELGLRRVIIAVARRETFIEDFVECTFGRDLSVEFIVPSRHDGVGLTVKELLDRSQTKASLVVLGDTHFTFADPSLLESGRPFVLVQPVEDSKRWCVAEIDSAGDISALFDKKPDVKPPLSALIGVYGFSDTQLARRAATEAVEASRGGRTELSMILDRVKKETPIRAVKAGDWLDVGNPDRLASSHRALLQKRVFNELSIDPVFGLITKRSKNSAKFIDEINYYRLLPPELAILFPRILDFSTDWEAPWIKMEYYGYPSLSEVFLFENVDPAFWEQVFSHLFQIVEQGFMRFRRPMNADALRDMYLVKTRQRLAEAKGSDEFLRLIRHEGTLRVNGRELANLPLLWGKIGAAVERLDKSFIGTAIHGDLCLSNILYDLRSRICKLVDPRGSFGGAGIFGDPRYDVAKLYHSVFGLYDFIVNDIFHVAVNGTEIELAIHSGPQHKEIRSRFEKVFFPAFDKKDIQLVTGLLFASMPALHYDAPRRQLAMYVRSLEVLDEALAE